VPRRIIPARVRSFYGRRKHKKLALLATGIVPLVMAGAALAFILASFTGSTSQASPDPIPNQASSADVSAELVFHDGGDGVGGNPWTAKHLNVGGSAPYDLDLQRLGTESGGSVGGVSLSVTVDAAHAAGCPASDFQVTNTTSYPVTIQAAPGVGSNTTVAVGEVDLASDPNVDQSGCSGATPTLHATLN
jgi:hypothetical protein